MSILADAEIFLAFITSGDRWYCTAVRGSLNAGDNLEVVLICKTFEGRRALNVSDR